MHVSIYVGHDMHEKKKHQMQLAELAMHTTKETSKRSAFKKIRFQLMLTWDLCRQYKLNVTKTFMSALGLA